MSEDINYWLEKLNEPQKEAVLRNDGPLVIIAGAGSGKTRTLTTKLSYLVQEMRVKPWKILAVTFTNKAAKEMRIRVEEMIGSVAQNIQISTYHSLCVRILRQESHHIGFTSNFNIIDNLDQKQILKEVYRTFTNITSQTHPYNEMINFISRNKMLKNSPQTLIELATMDNEVLMAKIYGAYLNHVKKSQSLDFDDLLIYVDKLFKTNPDVAGRWSNRFSYVLVDEFQDTSKVQYSIMKVLGNSKNITIVGDPDQTIYTWRYADAELINLFKKDFPDYHEVKLLQNYRSTQVILDAANKLIKFNKKRIEKDLYTNIKGGHSIQYFHAHSDEFEAKWIVEKIFELKRENVDLKKIAILYRANYISNSIEKQLTMQGMNYQVLNGVMFYQRQEIKDSLAFLKVINTKDNISFSRIINVPPRKLGLGTIEKITKYAFDNDVTLAEVVFNHLNDLPITSSAKNNLNELLEVLRISKENLATLSISKTLKKTLKDLNYLSVYKELQDREVRQENIDELLRSIDYWQKQNPERTLSDYLSEISLMTDADRSFESTDYVSLMTVHSAKGLEFENVFIAGFSDGIFPSHRSINDDNNLGLEEERRLAYVAVTRAQKRLFISDANGFSVDYKSQRRPSRFLEELSIYTNPSHSFELHSQYQTPNFLVEDRQIEVGEKLKHSKFGVGIVLELNDDLVMIKFPTPYGVKSLLKNHKSLERVD